MDACHVLLGRPWMYDRRVEHDGYHNTYSFVHHKLHFTLAPLAPKANDQKASVQERAETVALLLRTDQPEMGEIRELILAGLYKTTPSLQPGPEA